MEKVINSLFERSANYLKKQIKEFILRSIQKRVQTLIKSIFYSVTGAALVLIGSLFIGLGVTEFLSFYMPSWLSWIMVGIILTLIGAIIALLAIQKFK